MQLLQAPNVGGLSEATIKVAYEKFATNLAVEATISVVSILALIFMTYKIVRTYVTENKNGEFNPYLLIKILQRLGGYAVFIAAFPFIIKYTELAFANIQDGLKAHYDSSLESAGTQAISKFVNNYIDDLLGVEEDASLSEYGTAIANDLLNPFSKSRLLVEFNVFSVAVYSICIYILKYVYFFFCLGRYMWLIMLMVISPICVVCVLHEDTKVYFYSWMKNMLHCYLLIPFFLMADALSETVIGIIAETTDMSVYGMFGVIGMVIVKIFMFSYVSKKAVNLF